MHSTGDFDAIVIGGGLGGLVAGAKLSRERKRVLLLEQHQVVGGYATTFRRKDYTVEVGLHEMDGLDEDDPKCPIFEELNVFGSVRFLRLPEFYRFVGTRADVVLPHSMTEARSLLAARYPAEARGINAFFALLVGVRKELHRLPSRRWQQLLLFPVFPLLFRRFAAASRITLGDFLEKNFRDEELKLILAANSGYYGDDPFTLSLLYFAIAQGSFFSGGGHYIQGGSQLLSDHLARLIEAAGGTVLTRHEATRILVRGGRAAGVVFRNRHTGEEAGASAKAIIANAPLPLVVNELLPPDALPEAFRRKIDRLQPSTSFFSVYLGFNRPPRELGNRCYSTFFFDGVERLRDLRAQRRGNFAERPFAFVDYSQIEAGLAPPGKSFGALGCVDSLDHWEGLPETEYERKKTAVADQLIGRLEKLIPGISATIEYREAATPKTSLRYTRNPHGSIYGFAQTLDQSGRKRVGNVAPLPGLYFASAWAFPGGGFTGAILSGNFAAQEALRKLKR